MLQLELYVNGVELPEKLLTTVFDFVTAEVKEGWRLLSHADKHDIMLFDPNIVIEGVNHFPNITPGTSGAGIEIVLGVVDPSAARSKVQKLGLKCSDLAVAPWGTIEFTFNLNEGYLFRVKQITCSNL